MTTTTSSATRQIARRQYAPYRTDLKRAHKATLKLERRMRRALEEREFGKAHELKRILMRSHNAKLVALTEENQTTPPHCREKKRNLVHIANDVSVLRGSVEPVRIIAQAQTGAS